MFTGILINLLAIFGFFSAIAALSIVLVFYVLPLIIVVVEKLLGAHIMTVPLAIVIMLSVLTIIVMLLLASPSDWPIPF